MESTFARSKRVLGTVMVTAGVLAAGAFGSLTPAQAAIGSCPTSEEIASPGTIESPTGTREIFTDNNVAIYAGRNFTASASSAEVEGVLVVGGDATFDMTPPRGFNIGTVGVGSGVVPSPGSPMLVVGGDLVATTGNSIDVGANVGGFVGGGDVRVGGVSSPVAPSAQFKTNGGDLTTGMGTAALDGYENFGSVITSTSASHAGKTPTGTVTNTVNGLTLTFAGTGALEEVFTVTAEQLTASKEIKFTGIGDSASVIINVTGGPVDWAPNYFSDDGVRVDLADGTQNGFGAVATRTLWNFTDATSVHLGGSSQVLGSILVPGVNPDPTQPTLSFTASTNGRLYTNGSILMQGVGNEHHNYPFRTSPLECRPTANNGDDDATDADATDADATDADAADADAADADATDADAADADATDVDAADADAADADATDADATDADATDADATDADAADADAADADATDADATDADAADADATDADATDADATDADATDADAADADAADADATDADAADADAADADTDAADADAADTDGATTGTDGTDNLATTGGRAPFGLIGAGAVVLIGGSILLLAGRARRTEV
ncbi:choice-of-anchor A family protein [Microbacterium sp.]|uniref:choice-of-anchor A family protein n=1 Tax=Microbacterium sp. TaxID=51671 RepID=UPI0039E24630